MKPRVLAAGPENAVSRSSTDDFYGNGFLKTGAIGASERESERATCYVLHEVRNFPVVRAFLCPVFSGIRGFSLRRDLPWTIKFSAIRVHRVSARIEEFRFEWRFLNNQSVKW